MADISFPAYAVLVFTIIHSFSMLPLQAEKENDGFVLNQMFTEVLDKQRIHEASILLQQKNKVNQVHQIDGIHELQKVTKEKDDQKDELQKMRKLIKDQADQKVEIEELRKLIKDQADQKAEIEEFRKLIKDQADKNAETEELRKLIKYQADQIAVIGELRKLIKDQADQKSEIEELRKLIIVKSNYKTELVEMWKVIEDQAIEIGKLKKIQNLLKAYYNEIINIKAETDINQNFKTSQLIQHEHISNNIYKDEKDLAGRNVPVEDSVNKTNQSLNNTSIVGYKLYKRLLQAGSGGIAFSVYLDHDVDFGAHQILKYNRIITNEGNGYNVHTGSFTCPESGMYLLYFSIGQRGDTAARGAYIYLMVNSVNVIDAAVDSYHNAQDLQGGNTVIIRLKAGDVVFTEGGASDHVEGSTGVRLTSFSGVLLYP
ncbi:uncharacterized protein LOC143065509 [Mytilus galloprovincialis]|uniref:uncharacterized protein LOC143065509 n=1 Tax=Mytilus galloprovincialis TaxID=29158 RepID=UPI003F7C8077